MTQMKLHLALDRSVKGGHQPPDHAGLLWLQPRLQLKHFQTRSSVRLLPKEGDVCLGLGLFLYKHRYALQSR